jgi:hypothetical protein
MDATSMVLRFRDLSTDQGETIRQHTTIIQDKGYVWWGWWKKQGETVPLEAFTHFSKQIRERGPIEIYLFDTGTLSLFRARLAGISWDPAIQFILTPEKECTPGYYGESKYLAWFKLACIEQINESEAFIRGWSYVRVDEFFETRKSILQ